MCIPLRRTISSLLVCLIVVFAGQTNADDSEPCHFCQEEPGCIDYWIVRSHNCDQSADKGCRLEWYKHLKDVGLRDSSRQTFDQKFDPHVPLCIFVHGSMVSWKTSRLDAFYTNSWLRKAKPCAPIQFLFYSWPSFQCMGCPNLDYGILGRRASRNGIFLARILKSLPPETCVCLIGHSHGTRTVLSALHLLGGGEIQGQRICPDYQQRRLKTVLVAAAIDHDWLNPGERFDRAVCQSELMLNVVNHKDSALAFYPLRKFMSPAALGRSGLTDRDKRQLAGRRCRIREVDVTKFVGHGHMWPDYYTDPDLAHQFANTVFANE